VELVTVTFERVFEVSRAAGLRGPACSEFGFQAAKVKQYAVRVPGAPGIEAGMTVTALLEKSGDWHSLRGWKNWTTGELALPDLRHTALTTLASAVFCMLALVVALADGGSMPLLPWLFALVSGLAAVSGSTMLLRQRRFIAQLRELASPPAEPALLHDA
jgi:hypothetical protein